MNENKNNETKEVQEAQEKLTKNFKAETKQLLDLMIHSIYTNKEIFLRELISNASDAIDRFKFQSLTNKKLLEGDVDGEIFVEIDKKNKTISISDNGIGMSRNEVISNIGTIAKSGTRLFLEKMKNDKKEAAELIGQFGVGFYSSFIVADKVVLETRAGGKREGVKWESTADGTYTIEKATKVRRGTTVTLHLKEEFTNAKDGNENFLEPWTIERLVKKYSDYIAYPIKLITKADATPDSTSGSESDSENKENKENKTEENKILNSMKPLWKRDKSSITDEEYNQFYKDNFHDFTDPLKIIHTKAEGTIEFTALLFIPKNAPFDYHTADFKSGLKLYAKNVFITDEFKDVLPDYFRFVKGLVDSSDFPLNISREVLQVNRNVRIVRKNVEKKISDVLKKMLNEERKTYIDFWKNFGVTIKTGAYTNLDAKETLQDLLVFYSTESNDNMTTLKEYVERMPKGQEEIYYVVGKDKNSIQKLPQLEMFKEKNVEVLFFIDRVDEFMVQTFQDYNGKKLRSVSRGEIDLSKLEEKEKKEGDTTKDSENKEDEINIKEASQEYKNLIDTIKKHLGDRVNDVRLTNRLKSSAACLVTDDSGISIQMEQILSEVSQLQGLKANRILEINPKHPLFETMKKLFELESATLKDYSELIYNQALILEGIVPEDPVSFANSVAKLMVEAQQK